MSLSATNLVALGVASYKAGNDAELSVYAGCVTALLVMTHWTTTPVTAAKAKASLELMAVTDCGIPKTDWQDKVAAVFKVADKLVKLMPQAPEMLSIRDANDDMAALKAMRELFAIKGLTCRHYFKQWSKQDGVGKYDPELLNEQRRAKKEAELRLVLAMQSNIDASSEKALAAKAEAEAADKAATAALTPLQRFALDVAAISDAALLDAMHVALNARQAELAAITAKATVDAKAPKVPHDSTVRRTSKRRDSAAAIDTANDKLKASAAA